MQCSLSLHGCPQVLGETRMLGLHSVPDAFLVPISPGTLKSDQLQPQVCPSIPAIKVNGPKVQHLSTYHGPGVTQCGSLQGEVLVSIGGFRHRYSEGNAPMWPPRGNRWDREDLEASHALAAPLQHLAGLHTPYRFGSPTECRGE